jgi:Putative beta-lactamase-inhibitor-like, PepSY-like
MTKRILLLILVFATVFSNISYSQIREIPKEVREAFANKYPNAENVDFKDQLVVVYVHFTKDSIRYIATYNNKGDWKETEEASDYGKLPEPVKDGFQKSKYAEWNVDDAAIISQPGADELYRIKIEKNDLQKKYLYFNSRGRLMRDSLTL